MFNLENQPNLQIVIQNVALKDDITRQQDIEVIMICICNYKKALDHPCKRYCTLSNPRIWFKGEIY